MKKNGMTNRRYPIGIQTFSEIINGKYVSVIHLDLSLAKNQGSGKPVVKIGIGFSREKRTVSEWVVER